MTHNNKSILGSSVIFNSIKRFWDQKFQNCCFKGMDISNLYEDQCGLLAGIAPQELPFSQSVFPLQPRVFPETLLVFTLSFPIILLSAAPCPWRPARPLPATLRAPFCHPHVTCLQRVTVLITLAGHNCCPLPSLCLNIK